MSKKILAILGLFSGALYAQVASEKDWQVVGDTADAVLYAHPLRVMVHSKTSAEIWIKSVLKAPDKKGFSYTLTLYQVDCRSRRISITSYLEYQKDGTPKDTRQLPVNMLPVVPGSAGETFLGIACEVARAEG